MAVYPLYVAPTPYNASELTDMDYSQAFDAIYLANELYAPAKFTRNDHADWTFSYVSFGPALSPPGSVSAVATTPNVDAANSGDGYFPQDYSYIVSAVDANGQESRGSTPDVVTNDTELPRNFTTISWGAVTGAERYRVYKAHETGTHGYIGETTSTSFVDDGFQPEYSRAPITGFNPFASAGNYPARTNFWEQRLWWGRTTNAPNAFWASRSSEFENLDFARPQTESDSIAAAIATGETITSSCCKARMTMCSCPIRLRLRAVKSGVVSACPSRCRLARSCSISRALKAGFARWALPSKWTAIARPMSPSSRRTCSKADASSGGAIRRNRIRSSGS
jgi:hypothetical protein